MKTTLLILCFWLALITSFRAESTIYIEKNDFLAQAFGVVPSVETIWLDDKHKAVVSGILGHAYKGLRIRYWRQAQKSAWILDEIGKEKPITVGIVIDEQQVNRVIILAFRESRGWEVRYPFFTDQFAGSGLTSDSLLNKSIDGISGATLSVRAVTKVARLALYLHDLVVSNENKNL